MTDLFVSQRRDDGTTKNTYTKERKPRFSCSFFILLPSSSVRWTWCMSDLHSALYFFWGAEGSRMCKHDIITYSKNARIGPTFSVLTSIYVFVVECWVKRQVISGWVSVTESCAYAYSLSPSCSLDLLQIGVNLIWTIASDRGWMRKAVPAK